MIEIKEMKWQDFDNVYDELVKLQYQNTCLHFPDKIIDMEKHTKPKVKTIKEYMKENKAFLFIASENYKLVGFLWCYPNLFFDENRIYINSLIVKEEYRGQNIGQMLMKNVENKARELKCDSIYVSTASFNEGALKFYRKQNYKDERIQLVKRICDN